MDDMNNELGMNWKEAVVALLEIIARHMLGGTEKTTKYVSQDIRWRFKLGTSHIRVQVRSAII
jgi:hypothetical protein